MATRRQWTVARVTRNGTRLWNLLRDGVVKVTFGSRARALAALRFYREEF